MFHSFNLVDMESFNLSSLKRSDRYCSRAFSLLVSRATVHQPVEMLISGDVAIGMGWFLEGRSLSLSSTSPPKEFAKAGLDQKISAFKALVRFFQILHWFSSVLFIHREFLRLEWDEIWRIASFHPHLPSHRRILAGMLWIKSYTKT